MKRAIKSSFGLSDNSWLEPDDDFWEIDYDSVVFYIDNIKLVTNSSGEVENWDEAQQSIEEYYGDSEYVVGNNTGLDMEPMSHASERVLDEIESNLPQMIKPNSVYEVNGSVTLNYSFTKYEGPGYYDPEDSVMQDTIQFEFMDSSLSVKLVDRS